MYRVCGYSKRRISRELHVAVIPLTIFFQKYESAIRTDNQKRLLSDLLTIQQGMTVPDAVPPLTQKRLRIKMGFLPEEECR